MMDSSFPARLEAIVGPAGVIRDPDELLTYESDGLARLRSKPGCVVLPGSAAEVQGIVRLCHENGVPFVARGHGTGLSGGALPLPEGVLVVLSRLNRILDVDIPNQRVTVEPGVINLDVTRRVAPLGYYYAPDPSSQLICSIGGNVAENSGGAHCLKYGFTVHHVLGVEAILPNGDMVQLGGSALDTPGLDLLGALVGSEGRRDAGGRHEDHAPDSESASKRQNAAGRLRHHRSRRGGGFRDHRRRDHPRRRGDDGQADDRGGRSGGSSQFPAR
jgi:glycolate oxidase